MPFDFSNQSLGILLAVFAAAAALVWAAGTRLASYVDGISERTGIGRAFGGLLLLGGITSLPEVATVSTASATGDAPLALNNLLGSASMNVILLAFADTVLGREALTSVAAKPATLMQGVLSMLLLACVALAVAVGDGNVLGVGIGALVLAVGCIASLKIAASYEGRHTWEVVDQGDREKRERKEERSTTRLVVGTLIAALVILIAGFFLARTGDVIADRTGLGSSIVGFVLVAFATSLPEVSSVVGAMKMKAYELAVGDIFGTNLFNVSLILLADVVYQGEPVLQSAGRFETVGALLGVLLTGVFVVGLLERRDRTIVRMGVDSLVAIALFIGGIALLATVGGGSSTGSGG